MASHGVQASSKAYTLKLSLPNCLLHTRKSSSKNSICIFPIQHFFKITFFYSIDYLFLILLRSDQFLIISSNALEMNLIGMARVWRQFLILLVTQYTKLGGTSEVETCTRVIIFMVSNNLHCII